MTSLLQQGTVIGGRYRLDGLVGEGGMGVIWAATHIVTGKQAALKFMKSADPAVRARFVREARTATAVRHPNVVQFYDVLELDDGSPVLVMDLLRGETLGAMLKRQGRFPVGQFTPLLLDVLAAVMAAHEAGIVHRDLKPENIFLTARPDGTLEAKVFDFGIAKLVASETEAQTARLTETGTLIGTPSYMAVEQLLGERDIDARADVWALGVIAYECLSGTLPTAADNYGQVIKRILQSGIDPLTGAAPDVPQDVAAIVMRMLDRDRASRPALAEVAAVFERHAEPRARLLSYRPASEPHAISSGSRDAAASGEEVLGATLLASAAAPAPVAAPQPRKHRRLASTAISIAAIATLAAGAHRALRGKGPASSLNPTSPAAEPPSGPCPVGFVHVPGGTFQMGSEDGAADERPTHPVAVASFCLQRREVTSSAYTACVAQAKCAPLASTVDWPGIDETHRLMESQACAGSRGDRLSHPVNCVDWHQAVAFCSAIGSRLPTEQEWEYAARGGEQRRYPWGDAEPGPRLLNACGSECLALRAAAGVLWGSMYDADDGFPTTAPPGQFPAGDSRWAAQDMAGNVLEWTSSAYCTYPDHGCGNAYRVYRGGGWGAVLKATVRTTSRKFGIAALRDADLGFRCAKSL